MLTQSKATARIVVPPDYMGIKEAIVRGNENMVNLLVHILDADMRDAVDMDWRKAMLEFEEAKRLLQQSGYIN